MSCPSASFCAAVDDFGNVLTYNGSWSGPTNIDSANPLSSVSCPSASFCVAVDAQGNALTYNGSWSGPTNVDSAPLDSVSCPTASFCAAVAYQGSVVTYNGTSWSAPTNIDSTDDLSSVSCATASFCAAVDFSGNVLLSSLLVVTTACLPSGTLNVTYSATTLSATGGNPPYTWKLVPGQGSCPRDSNSTNTPESSRASPSKAKSSTFTVEVLDKKIKVKHDHPTQNTATRC